MDQGQDKPIDAAREALASGDVESFDAILATLHPADIAEILNGLEGPAQKAVLKRLDTERAAEVLTEIDENSGQALLLLLSDREVVSLLEEMMSDDAADLMSTLPPDMTARVGELLPREDHDQLRELMRFDEESAGGIMEIEHVSVRDDAVVDDAIEAVREKAEEVENVQHIYVVDASGGLVGQLTLLDLIMNSRSTPVRDIMNAQVISVPVTMDQEEVANLFGKYDEFTLPVVDDNEKLVGRITVDDIIDVIEEEASEDIAHIAGTTEEELGETSVFKVSRRRLPWLITGLIGQVVAALIMREYQTSISEHIVLAFFVPLIVGTAGSIGIQASVVVVRELALGQVVATRMGRRLVKELGVALVNGVVLGAILFGIVVAVWGDASLGALLIGSLLCVICVAAFVGTSLPLVFQRWSIDPALATGPFTTVLNDVIGLTIYLSLASAYLANL